MEKVIIQNGGKYSAELTKNCTHLISDISFFMVFGRIPFLELSFLFFLLNTEKFDDLILCACVLSINLILISHETATCLCHENFVMHNFPFT